MTLLPLQPEPVPLEDVATLLAHAILRLPGGPPCATPATGAYLAASLHAAGWRVVRDAPPNSQLTL
jgi:hypothetical protein